MQTLQPLAVHMLQQPPSDNEKIKTVCLHGSLLVASYFNPAIVKREYAGVRNILVGITKLGMSDVLRRISFQCDK
ncbi:hypothetical protein TNCV_1275131 [Trichonephila clavipes]|nr:hypothetical protein TNCV_1275131 [Trichonephila clavipes]